MRLPKWLEVLPTCTQIASILALILAWVYIFDTVLKEREALEQPAEGIVGAVPRDPEAPPPPGPGQPGAGRAAGQPTGQPRQREWAPVGLLLLQPGNTECTR